MENYPSKHPTSKEISELVAFLPDLCKEGFKPVIKWRGGEKQSDGAITFPWPEYDEVVHRFVSVASQPEWRDPSYLSNQMASTFEDPTIIDNADLNQLKTILTYFVRGERFIDGHWETMIQQGYICRLLRRLQELETH